MVQVLAEVFGFPTDNLSTEAERYRRNRLCPYHNRVPNCTKDKANDPLGVCSIYHSDGTMAVTCPIRFRQDWRIAEDAAAFFFPAGQHWTSLSEVRLTDGEGQSAGNVDLVLVSYDERGHILDFGALEVQAVYISGNVRQPFEAYMENPAAFLATQSNSASRPRPDYLSSSRKRLVPQLIYKGSILKAWGKKQAVALHRPFFATLPPLEEVAPAEADMAWLVYDLSLDVDHQQYQLTHHRTIYTLFEPALNRMMYPVSSEISRFTDVLQAKLNEKLDGDENSPDTSLLAGLT